ncbi:MAG: GHMP family kinase ATP-binding protein, partial [Microbacterium gubbeenense]
MTLVEEFPDVRVRAPAKINVFLAAGPRDDDGYHELATAFQAVSLFEDIIASHSDGFSLSITGPIDTSSVPTDDSNLALRAARLLAEHTEYGGGVHIDIRKEVPVAGGMAGGSADAAAALVACD